MPDPLDARTDPSDRLGYRYRRFDGYITNCARCRRVISSGVTHPRDTTNPPHHALCRPCYDHIVTSEAPPSPTERPKAL